MERALSYPSTGISGNRKRAVIAGALVARIILLRIKTEPTLQSRM